MKIWVLGIFLFVQTQANALTWGEVEEAKLILTQDIQHSSGQKFKIGGEFHFLDLVVGNGFLSFQFRGDSCLNPGLVSDEIDLLVPPGGNDKTAVGVQVGKDCLLQVFVETRDLQTRSFFEESF